MKKSNKCPYVKNVICEYMDKDMRGDSREYFCCDCPHYYPKIKPDPFDGRKTVGCLVVGIAILFGILALVGLIINSYRP